MSTYRYVHAPGLSHGQKLNLFVDKSWNRLGMVQNGLYAQHGVGRSVFADLIVFINVSVREAGRPRLFFLQAIGAGRALIARGRKVN